MFEKIREILCEQFDVDEDIISMETLLEDDLDADSIDLIDIAMSLEDEFFVEVPDEALEKFCTVGDIVAFIEEKA